MTNPTPEDPSPPSFAELCETNCPHGVCVMESCEACETEAEAQVEACEADGGHDYEVEADVGPDSGSEAFVPFTYTCRNCPAFHHVTYY